MFFFIFVHVYTLYVGANIFMISHYDLMSLGSKFDAPTQARGKMPPLQFAQGPFARGALCPGRKLPKGPFAQEESCPGVICPPGHMHFMSEMVRKLCFNLKFMMNCE